VNEIIHVDEYWPYVQGSSCMLGMHPGGGGQEKVFGYAKEKQTVASIKFQKLFPPV